MSDFAMIEHVVESKMPAKYEWMAAFGLAFTVLWIYIKVLDLLIQILGNRRS
ncbi:MAG: Bax inhibitor-1/YccA family protein [Ruminococcus sp.]|nr:Bax inhibitor-1/YccA family protein [Ruminococcus sp.]